eukprot:scaffold5776_cov53-Attheya_sp.AAC.3
MTPPLEQVEQQEKNAIESNKRGSLSSALSSAYITSTTTSLFRRARGVGSGLPPPSAQAEKKGGIMV